MTRDASVKITVSHPDQGEQSAEIQDDYLLIVAGTAWRHSVTVHRLKDGTQTHVITVKGIRL